VNDRAALYAAILAHPDEDTPRLAFADYLEEHGDRRYAEFIRKQIELARVPEWDPLWLRTWNREHDVITGHRYDQFVPELPDGLEWPQFATFRRGFPWHAQSRAVEPFLRGADALFATVPLQALTINTYEQREPLDLTALFALPHLARLKQFALTFNERVTEATVRDLQASAYLRTLTGVAFEFARLEPGAVRTLFQRPLIEQLESIRLESGSVRWRDVADGIATAGGPHRLRSLAVVEHSSASLVAPEVFHAPLLRGLRELTIASYVMLTPNIRALCESPVVGGLESLTLSGVRPGVPGIKALAGCPALRGLRRLLLSSNHLGPAGAKALAASPHLAGLQVLGLSCNQLGDKGAIELTRAPFLANLAGLDLMHCDIGDAGAEALLDALCADRVVHFNLRSYKVKLSARVQKKIDRKFGKRCVRPDAAPLA
jgi:uncharacterized protein (TIGR02996 family)